MQRFLIIWSAFIGLGSLGCILSPKEDPEPEPEPVIVEECTENHDTFWQAGADGAMFIAIWNDVDPPFEASSPCNRLPSFSGGGGQGGGTPTYHFEPALVVPQSDAQYNVYWTVLDMEGNEIRTQSFELFAENWTAFESDIMATEQQVFISSSLRGKNVILQVELEEVGGDSVTAQAAVWLN